MLRRSRQRPPPRPLHWQGTGVTEMLSPVGQIPTSNVQLPKLPPVDAVWELGVGSCPPPLVASVNERQALARSRRSANESHGAKAEEPTTRVNTAGRMYRHVSSIRATAVIALSFLSTGCLVGPNYQRPQMPTPQQFR